MEQLLTPDFWKTVGTFVMSAPLINILLLIIAGGIGWWLRGREDIGEIKGLKAQLEVRDERLQLARETRDATNKWAVATAEGQVLREQARARKGDPLIPSVDRTVAAIEQANTSSLALAARTLTIGPVWSTVPVEEKLSPTPSDEPKSKD
jgi:hypothetical protein